MVKIAEEDVGADKALGVHGTDSLVAVELRNWISRDLQAMVILMDLLGDNTLATLTQRVFENSKLCENLRSQDGEAKTPEGTKS